MKMDVSKIKLIAFDLDGTLTQHKTKLSPEHRQVLDALGKKYKLLMAGAGMCPRIFNQMDRYPIDILGNYGMQFAKYNAEKDDIEIAVDGDTIVLRKHESTCIFCGSDIDVGSFREKNVCANCLRELRQP